jgi:DNA primase small subunit
MAPGVLVPDIVMDDALSSPNEGKSDSPPAVPVGDPPSDGSDKEDRKAALEDMFDDDDDDDEFLSSMVETTEAQKLVLRVSFRRYWQYRQSLQAVDHNDPEVMRIFYQRLFPFRHVFQWLNHSAAPGIDMAHREFAFTLPNDAYLRYLSFPTADLYVYLTSKVRT